MRQSWVLVPLAIASTGCSLLGRVTLMPNVDTTGAVGVEAKLTVGVGLTTAFDHEREEPAPIDLVAIPVSIAGGLISKAGIQRELGFDSGLEFARVGRNPSDVGFRVGGLVAYRAREGEERAGGTLASALLWTLFTAPYRHSLRSRIALGARARGDGGGRRRRDRVRPSSGRRDARSLPPERVDGAMTAWRRVRQRSK